MAPMPSTDHRLDADSRQILLAVAAESITQGIRQGTPLNIQADNYPESVRAVGACFVTLHTQGELRGCIGSLEAYRPLVTDVADNAYAAAFRDPRFTPLRAEELPELDVHISVLGPAEPLKVRDEADLIDQLRPGIDGLILQERDRRGTFLPSVWASLPDPAQFVRHLKRKAGLADDYWSDSIQVWRYTTESFSEAR